MKKAGMKKTLLVVLLCGTLMWSACSTAWIGEAEQIVAALIPAAANMVTLVAALRGRAFRRRICRRFRTRAHRRGRICS